MFTQSVALCSSLIGRGLNGKQFTVAHVLDFLFTNGFCFGYLFFFFRDCFLSITCNFSVNNNLQAEYTKHAAAPVCPMLYRL